MVTNEQANILATGRQLDADAFNSVPTMKPTRAGGCGGLKVNALGPKCGIYLDLPPLFIKVCCET